MVTLSYTAAFNDLARTLDLSTDLDSLTGLLDFGDSLGAFMGAIGSLAPVSNTPRALVLADETFTVTFHKRGDDLITVEEAGTGTILELDRLYEAGNPAPIGLEVTSGHQRLWLEGDLPDSFAEITDLVGDLFLGADLLTALSGYSLQSVTVVIEDPADGSLSFPFDITFLPEGLTATILGYTLTASAPGVTLDDILDLGQAFVGLLSGTSGFRPLVRALEAMPPVDIGLATPAGAEIFGLEGDLADLLTPRKVRIDFTGDDGRDSFLGGAGRDRAEGAGGADRLFGFGHDDVLSGGAGRDRIVGGRGDDTQSGGRGGDLFVFNGQFDSDTITDFGTGADRIALRGQGLSFDTLDLSAVNGGADTLIRVGAAGQITLEGVAIGDLTADNFVL